MGEPEDQDGDRPAAAGSQLVSLRARRAKAEAELTTDLKVPGYDPEVFVRFKPVKQSQIDAANKAMAASKDTDKTVITNAIVLANACVGVFVVHDGADVSPVDGGPDLPRFDEQLSGGLGVNATKAADVVRALYLKDGDIISTAEQLWEWSGFRTEQLERDFEGN